MTAGIINSFTLGRHKFAEFLSRLSCVFFIIFISACGGGGNEPSSSETGAITCNIALQHTLTTRQAAGEPSEDCEAAGVDAVRVEVYDGADFYLTEGGPWPCSAHKGSVRNVREGSDRKVVILCEDSDGNVRYRGEHSGITVTRGETTHIGTVVTCFFIPTLSAPANGSNVTGDAVTLAWDAVEAAKEYRIVVSKNSDLGNPIVDQSVYDTSFDLEDLSEAATCYWQVHALDSVGNEGAGSDIWKFGTYINSPPVLNPIGAKPVDEGELLEFTITATDPDGDTLTYSASGLPYGSSFDPVTHVFIWIPDYYQAGEHDVVFTVTDDGSPNLSDSETVTVTVWALSTLVAYYPFNGNANDESGNENNGTVYGATLTEDRYESPASAYNFDGDNDSINVPDDSSLDIIRQISLSAWIFPTEQKTQFIIRKGPEVNPPPPYGLSLSGTGDIIFELSPDSEFTQVRKQGYDLDQWTFIVGTYDGTTMKLYVNGNLENSETIPGNLNENGSPLLIGTRLNLPADTFAGKLDDISVYNRALAEAEIEQLYDGELHRLGLRR